jgi:hypothetical protein
VRGSGLEAKDLQVPSPSPAYLASTTEVLLVLNPERYSMFKAPEKKDFPPRKGGTLAGNRPPLLTQKTSKWSAGKKNISENSPFSGSLLMLYFNDSARDFPVDPTAERWQSG